MFIKAYERNKVLPSEIEDVVDNYNEVFTENCVKPANFNIGISEQLPSKES